MKMANCANCHAPLSGPWCALCGQKASSLDPTWHDLFHEALHEFVHFDSKFATTIKTLFRKPGRLTTEHLQGRRVRYVGPLRLYLMISAIYFVLSVVIPNPNPDPPTESSTTVQSQSVRVSRPSGIRSRILAGTVIASGRSEYLNELIAEAFPKMMFVLVPVFAIVLRILYRDRHRNYPQFLYFALHFHAAVFGLLIVTVPLQALQSETPLKIAEFVVLIVALIYLLESLKSVFGGSTLQAIARTLAAAMIYGAVVFVVVGGTILSLLYWLGS
jgi:hypothetical protein